MDRVGGKVRDRGLEAQKKGGLKGRGVSAQKLNFHAMSQKRPIRMKK